MLYILMNLNNPHFQFRSDEETTKALRLHRRSLGDKRLLLKRPVGYKEPPSTESVPEPVSTAPDPRSVPGNSCVADFFFSET